MATADWTRFPFPGAAYAYAGDALRTYWIRLHRGDCEPFPAEPLLQDAWRLYHRGEFQQAHELGLSLGLAGYTVANRAAVVYAVYLEKSQETKRALFQDAAARAEKQIAAMPKNANAHYLRALAVGRYAQRIPLAKALTQGLVAKVKEGLNRTLALEPNHADAHIAMGALFAEVIDKVGSVVGGATYGARKDAALEHFEEALRLNPDSAIARIEYANALALLYGQSRIQRADRLYEEAAACKAMDAAEWLDVELARSELDD